MAFDWTPYISAGISIVGAGLSFIGAQKGAKTQQINMDKSIKKDLEIARMQLEEKTVTENQIQRLNKICELVSEYIGICFDINFCMDVIKSKTSDQKEKKKESEKYRSLAIKVVGIATEIKLNIFDEEDGMGVTLVKEIVKSSQYYSKTDGVPADELDHITDVASKYFDLKWKEINKSK